MDESFHELEAELKSLRPRGPSAQLRGRLEAELGVRARYTTATNLDSAKWLGWRMTSLAATLALVAGLGIVRFRRPGPAIAPSAANIVEMIKPSSQSKHSEAYEPVAASNVLYDLKDEGLVKVDGDAPARRLRYRYVDTYTWKNPKSNASLKWSVPRDEIRLVSATMN